MTLFLDGAKTELIQKECLRVNCPLISFGGVHSSRSSSSIFVGGNYTSFASQSIILTLLSLSFSSKQDYLLKRKTKK